MSESDLKINVDENTTVKKIFDDVEEKVSVSLDTPQYEKGSERLKVVAVEEFDFSSQMIDRNEEVDMGRGLK